MAQEDTTKYNPKIFIRGKSVNRLLLSGDEAPNAGGANEELDFLALSGDQYGALLLSGDEA